MRLESLNISRRNYPKPEHWEGTIEYRDDDCKSKIELRLTSEQIEGIFPIVADKLIEVSRQAAHILTAEVTCQQEKTKEMAA